MFEQVTIMFNYLIGFNELCATISAMHLVECINSIFTALDSIIDKYDVFKVISFYRLLNKYTQSIPFIISCVV